MDSIRNYFFVFGCSFVLIFAWSEKRKQTNLHLQKKKKTNEAKNIAFVLSLYEMIKPIKISLNVFSLFIFVNAMCVDCYLCYKCRCQFCLFVELSGNIIYIFPLSLSPFFSFSFSLSLSLHLVPHMHVGQQTNNKQKNFGWKCKNV